MRFFTHAVALVLLAAFLAGSCKPAQKQEPKPAVEGTYFSVRQFVRDQFNTYRNQPFVFLKVVQDGQQTDSSYVAADTMDWKPVLDAFSDADIGDTALVGRYKYSEFDEGLTGQHMFLYEAAAPELTTRQLMIGADPFTGRILSIYMDVNLPKGKTQKLYYATLKLIQIQQFSGKGDKARNLRVEYFFPQMGNDDAEEFTP